MIQAAAVERKDRAAELLTQVAVQQGSDQAVELLVQVAEPQGSDQVVEQQDRVVEQRVVMRQDAVVAANSLPAACFTHAEIARVASPRRSVPALESVAANVVAITASTGPAWIFVASKDFGFDLIR